MTTTTPLDGPFMTSRQLTSYPEALDAPRPEGVPTGTALRMAALLRGDRIAAKERADYDKEG